jgi:hypothetical protein
MPAKQNAWLLLLIFSALLLAGCGGSGGGSSDPPMPSFTIELIPSTLSISPNTTAHVTLLLHPLNGFNGFVGYQFTDSPFGMSVSPAIGSGQSSILSSGVTITLTTGSVLAGGNSVLSVQATSGTLSAIATASLTATSGFTISVDNPSLTIRNGGTASDNFTLIGANNNFSVKLSFSGLPSGVTASFSQNPVSATVGMPSFTLTAAANAPPVQNISPTLTAVSTSDGATASVSFFLTVAPPGALPGTRTNFVGTDDTPSSIVYDSLHSQIFAALPDLAKVSVISSASGQIIKSIPVPDAQGLSLIPDGTRVLVTGNVQQAVWIDTASLQLVRRDMIPMVQPACSCPPQFVLPGNPMAMANGKVLLNGVEWDPAAGQAAEVNGTTLGARSADGTKAILLANSVGNGIEIYDSATDKFTATHTFSDAPLAFAANSSGSQFAVAVADESTYIFDGQLNSIGQAPVSGLVTAMHYSPDGRTLYIVSVPGTNSSGLALISTVDATSFSLLGQTQAYQSRAINIKNMDVDSTGMVFGASDHGVVLDDSTTFRTITAKTPAFFGGQVSPAEGPLNTSTQVSIQTGNIFDTLPDVWFGNLRGTSPTLIAPSSDVQVTAPPSSIVGPVLVKMISPDGLEADLPDGFTYGSLPVAYGSLAASPSSGISADLFGYGFSAYVPGAPIQVQTASGNAPVTLASLAQYALPLEHVRVTVPPGVPGAGNITVTSPAGTAEFVKGLHYLQSVTAYSSTDAFNYVIQDTKRNQLYLSAGDHVDVFSLTTNSFASPIAVPSLSGARQLDGLALTPDDSKLLAANFSDNSIAVIDPDNPSTANAVQVVPAGVGNGSVGPVAIATTSNGLAFISTANGNLESGTTLNVYQLSLSTEQVSTVNILGNSLVSGSRSGTTAFAFVGGDSGGSIYSWNAGSGGWSMMHNTKSFLFDSACSGDGNVSAIDMAGGFGFANTVIEFLDPQTNLLGHTGLPEFMYAVPAIPGMKLNDSGSLVYIPVTVSFPNDSFSESAVDLYDVNHNELRERILLSQSWPQPSQNKNLWNSMAIDPGGQTVFLITQQGLTIVALDAVPLSIGHVTPQSGIAGAPVTIRGSGFVPGMTATLNGVTGPVSFVDTNTLQATIPSSLSSGAVSISLGTPGGSTYTLDAAYNVN